MGHKQKSKFQDRLNSIRREQTKKSSNNKTSNAISKEETTIKVSKETNIPTKTISVKIKSLKTITKENTIINRKVGIKKHETSPKTRQKETGNKHENIQQVSIIEKNPSKETNDKINKLEIKIYNQIKKKLNHQKDQLEILHSELFLLQDQAQDQVESSECQRTIQKIENLLNHIIYLQKELLLISKYYDSNDIVYLDSKTLYQDIVTFRDLVQDQYLKQRLTKEYQSLDTYLYLYQEIENITEQIEEFENQEEKKMAEYQIREKYLNIATHRQSHINTLNLTIQERLKDQSLYLSNLDHDINQINSITNTKYDLVGLNNLLGLSLRYLGLMMVAPLTGILPGITISTLATRKMLKKAKQHFHIEEIKTITYHATNYHQELEYHLQDISSLHNLLKDTSQDIQEIKEQMKKQFPTEINTQEYQSVYYQLSQIEEIINHNTNKTNIIETKMKKYQHINDEKIKRLQKLNKSS